jgi:[ribosomal protein S5]-alanine N-acetyltransferase
MAMTVINRIQSGKRVFLRSPEDNDAREFCALSRDSVTFHRGLVAPPRDEPSFLEYLERCRRPDAASFLICVTQNKAVAGAINLSQIFRGGFQNAYLGYFMGAPFAGKGFGTEALQLMLRHAFKELKLHRVEANIQPGNVASIAMVQRAGFVREGYSKRYLKICGKWRDHERWAMIAEDWKPINVRQAASLSW